MKLFTFHGVALSFSLGPKDKFSLNGQEICLTVTPSTAKNVITKINQGLDQWALSSARRTVEKYAEQEGKTVDQVMAELR